MRLNSNAPAIFPHAHNILDVANVHRGQRSENGVAFNPHGCEVIFAHEAGCWQGDDKIIQGCNLAEFGGYVLELTLGLGSNSSDESPMSLLEKAFAVGSPAVIERLAEQGIEPVAAGTALPAPAGVQAALNVTGIVGKQARATTPVTDPKLWKKLEDATLVTAPTPSQIGGKRALGLIEAKLVDASDHIGGAGTILMSPLEYVDASDGITEVNGQLVTKATGSKVIVGNIAPGHVYGVLGELDVYLGPVETAEGFDRGQNVEIVQAEMFVTIAWNLCTTLKAATA